MSGSLKLTMQRMPMLRLLLPFMAGIVVQWYSSLPFLFSSILALTTFLLLLINERSAVVLRFQQARFIGILLHLFLFSAVTLLTWQQDVRNNDQWIGYHYQTGQALVLTLEEPLVEKPNSYKAI